MREFKFSDIRNYGDNRIGKIVKRTLLAVLLLSGIAEVDAARRYVTHTGAGVKDGSSWANASNDPQAMINISKAGDEIWVATGTYKPMHSANGWTESTPTGVNANPHDKHNSFVLKTGVKVYGGFGGFETELAQRDWMGYRTILSGDYNGDDYGNDSSWPTSSENAYHIVITVNTGKETVLDGFTIWGGNYYGEHLNYDLSSIPVNGESVLNRNGGGIYAHNSAVSLRNLEIRRNAAFCGAGIYCYNSSDLRGYNLYLFKNFASQGGGLYVNGSPKFKNVIIMANEGGIGAGVSNAGYGTKSEPHYINVLIHGNLGSIGNGYGAGMQNEVSSPVLTNVTIVGNYGGSHPGIYNYYNCWPTVNNSIIWNNIATDMWGNGYISNLQNDHDCVTTFNNSLLQGADLTGTGGLDATVSGFDPGFINPPGYGWNANTLGSFTLKPSSPCIDAGNSDLYKAACDDEFEGWDKEIALTPPPYTPFYDTFEDFFGAWYLKDVYSGKEALRLGGDKINIGAFEGTIVHTATVSQAGWAYGDAPKDPKMIDCPENATVTYHYSSIPDVWLCNDPDKPTNAGKYYVQAKITFPEHYESIRTAPVEFTVEKASFISAVSLSDRFYGEPACVPSINSNPGNGKVTYLYDTSAGGAFTSTVQPTNAGTYYVKAKIATTDNYKEYTTPATAFQIKKVTLTVTPDERSRFYGGENPSFSVSYSGFVNNETKSVLTQQPTAQTSATKTSNVGKYDITLSGGSAVNYEFAFRKGILTVNKAPLTVSADNKERLYGEDNPEFTVSYSGFVNDETKSVLSQQPVAQTSATKTSNVNTYDINVSGGSTGNYDLTYKKGTLTVNKAQLLVKADNKNRTYDEDNPSFSVSYSGFVNNETKSVLTQQPTTQTSATRTSNAGTYDITVSGGSAVNYDLSYQKGTLTVEKRSINMNVSESELKALRERYLRYDLSSVNYNGQSRPVSVKTAADITGMGALTVKYAGSTSIPLNAGTHLISVDIAEGTNYKAISGWKLGDYTINKIPLNVTADNKSRAYGSDNPSFTVGYSGFVNNESKSVLTKEPTAQTSATKTSNVGTYDITASGGSSVNYEFTYKKGTLTVNKAPLTVTADNKSRTYGGDNPSFTAGYSGFVNNESKSVLTQEPTVQTSATKTSNVGTYDITASGGSSVNYEFTYKKGTLTVNKAPLTVTADNKSRTYGGDNPSFTAGYSGFVNNESKSVLTQEPTVQTSATRTSNVGIYDITASGGSSVNYEFTYKKGTLTVNKAPLIVTADNKSRTYGGDNPSFTVSYSGFVNNESKSVLTQEPTAQTSATKTSNAGTYDITASAGSGANYEFTYKKGTLTINKAPQSINFKPDAMLYIEKGPYVLIATASSGLTVKFKVNDNNLAEIFGNQLILKQAGVVEVTAYVESSGNYEDAQEVTAKITLLKETGINLPESKAGGLQIFPNPVTNGSDIRVILPFVSTAGVQNEYIEVYNIMGQFVQKLPVPPGVQTFETPMKVPVGNYILRWKGYEKKLIVK